MTDEKPDIAVAWYRSRILQGLLTVLVTQMISRVQAQYHLDLAVMGFGVNDIVSWLMDLISAAALTYAAHARVAPSVPIPPVVTLTKSEADKVNLVPPFVPTSKEVPK